MSTATTITKPIAACWIKHLARDFDVPPALITFLPKETGHNAHGDYLNGHIRIFGQPSFQVVLHEFAHHVHAARLGYTPHRGHAVGFHRICFEIRDWVRTAYGVDVIGINGYRHTAGFRKALNEWYKRQVKGAAQ